LVAKEIKLENYLIVYHLFFKDAPTISKQLSRWPSDSSSKLEYIDIVAENEPRIKEAKELKIEGGKANDLAMNYDLNLTFSSQQIKDRLG
jgi:hypothetical protein